MPLIVIEGLDGSGKATNAALLKEYLETSGKTVKKITFPVYESDSSALIKMYLAGEFGKKPTDVGAYAASAFYAVDRFASYKKDWEQNYKNGEWIIADRYTTSNAVHQASKLEGDARDEYLLWLYEFEFEKMGLPKPDAVIYLDVPPEVSQKLIENRYNGDNTKKDIHESDVEYLNHCRDAALYAAHKLGWYKIALAKDGKMDSRENNLKKITDVLKGIYGDNFSFHNAYVSHR